MPLADPVLVLADEARDQSAPTQASHELLALARRVGTPLLVHRDEMIVSAQRNPPRAILIPASPANDQFAAHVAVRLESPILADITDLSLHPDHEHLVAHTDHFSTEILSSTAVISIRPRSPDVTPDCLLTEAAVVVAGGRGVGSAEGFSLLARIAAALGGCLGGTGTARELGWVPSHACINLPGAQIRPRLYLAGGVSGSVRHRAAIRGARTVVAIDSDPDAPILREADFGIVGDLHEILPALLDELAARSASAPAPPPAASPAAPRTAARSHGGPS